MEVVEAGPSGCAPGWRRSREGSRRRRRAPSRPSAGRAAGRRWRRGRGRAAAAPASAARAGRGRGRGGRTAATSFVWTVVRTRCPVSAAVSTVRAVASSRISPTRRTSGSWRRAATRAVAKSGASAPISICSTTTPPVAVLVLDRVLDRDDVELLLGPTRSTRAASVVVFPEPVAPVTRTRPRAVRVRSWSESGSPSSARVGIRFGRTRIAAASPACVRWTFIRKRPSAATRSDRSAEPASAMRRRRSAERAGRTRSRTASGPSGSRRGAARGGRGSGRRGTPRGRGGGRWRRAGRSRREERRERRTRPPRPP